MSFDGADDYAECVNGVSGDLADEVVGGRLAKYVEFWKVMGASPFIQNIIKFGYVLPFACLPACNIMRNHKSAESHRVFVSQEVESLLGRGCIKEVEEKDVMVCSPLGVVDNGVKLRLILDLRYVNCHLRQFRFKLEDLKVVASVYKQGDYLVTFDLKSGYHHIAIAEGCWKYLGFSWEGRFFVFCVLPFGLSSAPYIFTKISRVLLRFWRKDGIRCQLYMDDGSGGHETMEGAKAVADRMRADLLKAGFVPNEKKCQWEPSHKVRMLGMEIDMEKGIIQASENRVDKLKQFIRELMCTTQPNAKQLARLTGYLLSMSLALGPICRLRTRSFYAMILSRKNWSKKMEWSEEAWSDLEFWSESFHELHGRPLWKKGPLVAVLTWSDASESGWGGYLQQGQKLLVAHGEWEQEVLQEHRSSTWREVRAVALVLESLSSCLEGQACIHRTDNQAAAHIIMNGSRRPHLQKEALRIQKACLSKSIRLSAEWVPREENELADYYSKVVDTDDWQLNPEVFKQFDQAWGPHTLDCFASLRTKQMDRYCSRWWNPGCFAIDAFTVDWCGERVWLVPPIYLLPRVLDMIFANECHGTLILPSWASAPWWPRICSSKGWVDCIKEVCYLPCDADVFVGGTCPWNLFGGGKYAGDVLALRICTVDGCSTD